VALVPMEESQPTFGPWRYQQGKSPAGSAPAQTSLKHHALPAGVRKQTPRRLQRLASLGARSESWCEPAREELETLQASLDEVRAS